MVLHSKKNMQIFKINNNVKKSIEFILNFDIINIRYAKY